MGNTYFQMGHFANAIREFERYIRLATSDRERARGYESIAYVYWKRGNLDLAEKAASEEMKFNKDTIEIPLLLALERGDEPRISALKEQYLSKIDMGRGRRRDARICYFLEGFEAFKKGQTEDAIRTFKEVLHTSPQTWYIDSFEDCLANAYLELGRFDEAIVEYKRILRLNPNYPFVHYQLAQAFERKGVEDRARNEYKLFLQVWKSADADMPEIKTALRKSNSSINPGSNHS